ncbi:MAG: DUF368 domain-containing protein [Hydrogeniiclostridium sp.]
MLQSSIGTLLKGFIIGGTMLVPGVSGGSMAMIIGIYDRLISSVSSFMKHKKESFVFLLLFCVGAVAGMLLLARPLLRLIELYPLPAMYFFIGAVAGGIPLIFRQSGMRTFSIKIPLYIVLGAGAVVLLSFLPSAAATAQMEPGPVSFLLLALSGFIAAVALILPGISVSYLLLLMGLYNETMRAISTLYFPFLIPLALGLVLGILLTTKLLDTAMKKHPQPTYLIILGFILGSIVTIFPGVPTSWDTLYCILTLAAGYAAIRLLSRAEEKSAGKS